jgi:hypothetical protein
MCRRKKVAAARASLVIEGWWNPYIPGTPGTAKANTTKNTELGANVTTSRDAGNQLWIGR